MFLCMSLKELRKLNRETMEYTFNKYRAIRKEDMKGLKDE